MVWVSERILAGILERAGVHIMQKPGFKRQPTNDPAVRQAAEDGDMLLAHHSHSTPPSPPADGNIRVTEIEGSGFSPLEIPHIEKVVSGFELEICQHRRLYARSSSTHDVLETSLHRVLTCQHTASSTGSLAPTEPSTPDGFLHQSRKKTVPYIVQLTDGGCEYMFPEDEDSNNRSPSPTPAMPKQSHGPMPKS
ncbi:hypothetical protein BT69DRAFT_1327984 [Atractiella rhizophila]|nr:hypothetical protein BT69DRAFT_1327984 [Atractiella rhizophila]